MPEAQSSWATDEGRPPPWRKTAVASRLRRGGPCKADLPAPGPEVLLKTRLNGQSHYPRCDL